MKRRKFDYRDLKPGSLALYYNAEALVAQLGKEADARKKDALLDALQLRIKTDALGVTQADGPNMPDLLA